MLVNLVEFVEFGSVVHSPHHDLSNVVVHAGQANKPFGECSFQEYEGVVKKKKCLLSLDRDTHVDFFVIEFGKLLW